MPNKYIFLLAVFVSLGVAGAYTGLAGNMDTQKKNSARQAQTDSVISPAKQQGYRVYIDPATGKRTTPPPGTTMPSVPRAVGVAPQPMIINFGPGKGVAMDMRGQYQEMKATVDKTGHVSTRCEPAPTDHAVRGGSNDEQ